MKADGHSQLLEEMEEANHFESDDLWSTGTQMNHKKMNEGIIAQLAFHKVKPEM